MKVTRDLIGKTVLIQRKIGILFPDWDDLEEVIIAEMSPSGKQFRCKPDSLSLFISRWKSVDDYRVADVIK